MLTTRELALRPDIELGQALVSPSARRVTGPGGSVAIEPRVMQVLVVLAEAAGKVVSRDMLFRRCWGGVHVGEDSLNRAVAAARRVGDMVAAGSFLIETIPRTGYRLTHGAASPAPPQKDEGPNGAAALDAIEEGMDAWRLGMPAVPTRALDRLRWAVSDSGRADIWGLLALLLRDAAEYAQPADCGAFVSECWP